MTEYDILHKIVSQSKAPYPKFVIDLVEYPAYCCIRIYRDNFEMYSDPQRGSLAEYINELIRLSRAAGVKTFLEVHANVPRKTTNRGEQS